MTEHARQLHELVSHAPFSRDMAAAACRILFGAPEAEQPELFVRFLLEYKYTKTDASMQIEPYFTQEDMDLYYNVCLQLQDQWLEALQSAYSDEKEFHRALWQNICTLSNQKLRTMMVLVCAETVQLPYLAPSRTALGDHFTAESFRAAAEQIDPAVRGMLHHILHQDYPQVDQDAAALLPLLDACSTQEEKVVLLTMMFLSVHKKIEETELRNFLDEVTSLATDALIRETEEEYEG